MKKLLIIMCLIPNLVLAEPLNEFQTITDSNITTEKEINGSSIIAGDNITTSDKINGINMLFGNNIEYKSDSDYAFIFGNNINVKGNINNDGFIFGNIITLNNESSAKRDLFIFGNEVIIEGEVVRNITIYAQNVTIKGNISGNATISASNITVEDAKILGELAYDSENIVINNSDITSKRIIENTSHEVTFLDEVKSYISSLLGIIVLFIASNFVFPNLFKKLENQETTTTNIISLIGYGALMAISVPFISILIAMFGITIPLVLFIFAIYFMIALTSTIISGYFIGHIVNKLLKKEFNQYIKGIIGIFITTLLALIPTVGSLITILTLMLSYGLVLKLIKD